MTAPALAKVETHDLPIAVEINLGEAFNLVRR